RVGQTMSAHEQRRAAAFPTARVATFSLRTMTTPCTEPCDVASETFGPVRVGLGPIDQVTANSDGVVCAMLHAIDSSRIVSSAPSSGAMLDSTTTVTPADGRRIIFAT